MEIAVKLFPITPDGTNFNDTVNDVFNYLTQDYKKEEPTNE